MNATTYAAQNVYSFEAPDIDGNPVSLEKYRGQTLLIVNTASKCGFTGQYASLQKLYEKYAERGFTVLAFPSNNFGNQEPGTNQEIKEFCDLRFKIKFPLFSKIDVTGKNMHPLYDYLTNKSEHRGTIKWNFTKFLVNPDGQVVARFSSMKDPFSPGVQKEVEAALP